MPLSKRPPIHQTAGKGKNVQEEEESDGKSCRKEGVQDLTCPSCEIQRIKGLLKIKKNLLVHFESNKQAVASKKGVWDKENCLQVADIVSFSPRSGKNRIPGYEWRNGEKKRRPCTPTYPS